MILRGITRKGKPYFFKLEDCPVVLDTDTTVLINKPMSPLLSTNSIVIGDEESGLFEGDLAINKETNEIIGRIIYKSGFKILKDRSEDILEIKDLPELETVVCSNKLNIELIAPHKSSIVYKVDDITFTLDKLVRIDNGIVTIYSKLLRKIFISDVKLCTGLTIGNNIIAYGDLLNGGVVVCHDYHPMIKMSNGEYKEIEV